MLYRSRTVICLTICLLTSVAARAQQPGSPGQHVDFAHDVVPILQKHCVSCHGGREAKGSFSLNTRELLVDSGHIVAGKPAESYLLELVASEDPETRMPPADKPRVSKAEQQVLRAWVAEGAVWEDGYSFAPVSYEPPLLPRRPELPEALPGRNHPVDRILDQYLASNGIVRPQAIDDALFMRRVSLDLVGLLPTQEQLHAFVASTQPNKREQLIDDLLNQQIAYADHWLTFFNDLLRNDYSGTGFITGGRTQISAWLYDALLQNMPFDVMARELIAPATPASRGYIDGIKWRGEVSAGQTVEIQFAQSISQSFLGINMKCASCHDSFIDRWKLDEAYGLAAIYSTRPLEIHRCDKPVGRQAQASWLFPELGQVDPSAERDVRLQQLASLMTHPDNGRFSRTIVNRLWYKLMGRGIVHPLDAMQSEPWNADLLDYLAVSLCDNHYDLKAVLRLIATSQAYQSQCLSQATEPGSSAYLYRGPVARRMTAEQFLDNVWQLTSAAPTTIDAPVFRAVSNDPSAPDLQLQAKWIWGDSASEGKTPPAGESISLRKSFKLEQSVERGGAVITCDNAFTLYINGREVSRGDNWTQPQAVAMHTLLKKGDNQIVVVASNAGNGPNPAGLFFESRLVLADQSTVLIASDETWEFNARTPNGREGRLGGIPGKWAAATVVQPVSSWTQTIDASARNTLSLAISGNVPMVRASLVKNDFLMKSLGRPLREQIVSMRPSELSTLEAIDLSNGAAFAASLQRGGETLASREWKGRSELIQFVFESTLCRRPTQEEVLAVESFLSREPSPTEIEDLLWAVFMMPEFMLVR
ncbi:MAG: DUF1549 domain-containing protein [Planctomycetaceae bacterium]|nr:DUF1549 domain-containing protein [Planctomycetaceae bacterium]